ncbi:MAG TPA: recombination protein O N-terminal domain-containing protein [Verrucomicrobiae bacterium]|nr:recombination protein O N-terminal domain-containing protein [Verrucomicrobiae bacterium]
MTPYSDRAIVLGRERSGETSLSLRLLCRGRGRIDALAKGAMGASCALASTLDLLHEAEVVLKPPGRGFRAWVQEAVLLDPFSGMRGDFARFDLACYFAGLVGMCVDRDHPVPEIYDLLRLALGHLNGHAASLRVMARFEWRLLELLGLGSGDDEIPAPRFVAIFGHNFHALPPARKRLLETLA